MLRVHCLELIINRCWKGGFLGFRRACEKLFSNTFPIVFIHNRASDSMGSSWKNCFLFFFLFDCYAQDAWWTFSLSPFSRERQHLVPYVTLFIFDYALKDVFIRDGYSLIYWWPLAYCLPQSRSTTKCSSNSSSDSVWYWNSPKHTRSVRGNRQCPRTRWQRAQHFVQRWSASGLTANIVSLSQRYLVRHYQSTLLSHWLTC